MCGALCQAHYHAFSFRPHPTLSGKNAEAKNKTDLSNWPKGVSARISLIAAYRNLLWHKEVEKGFAGSVWLAPCIHREPENRTKTGQLPASGITHTSCLMFLLVLMGCTRLFCQTLLLSQDSNPSTVMVLAWLGKSNRPTSTFVFPSRDVSQGGSPPPRETMCW